MIIGIIDDDSDEIDKIKRTIITIIKKNNLDVGDIQFKIYELKFETGKLRDSIIKQVIDEITRFEISLLIIDHKIMIDSDELVKGSDIFEQIKKSAPDFPTVILTNVVEASLINDYVDADKVYAKSEFFKIQEYAKEKTENIFRNIQRYEKLRNSAQQELEILKKELAKDTENQELVNQIVEKEKELDKYLPLQQSYLKEAIDLEEIKEILELLEEAKETLE